MNRAPINRALADKPPEESTLLRMIQREVWPAIQALLRTFNSRTVTTPLVVTEDTTLTGNEEFVKADATAGNITITLPSPENWMRYLTVMKVDGTASTVTVTSVATGDPTLALQWDKANFIQDGVSFYEV